jgi:hypothetical protein
MGPGGNGTWRSSVWLVDASWVGRHLCGVKVEAIKGLVQRQPFRPFAVRLSNGAQYTFKEARAVGAPKDYHVIFYFGDREFVPIDTENIVQFFER